MSTKHSITWEGVQKSRKRLESETGTIHKDWGGKLPFALIYPNSYYLGMSNLGLHAIYGFLNRAAETVCERAFWEKENQQGMLPLSLESQRPLTDYAVLAFSLNYEIDYFNIAPILKASDIPLYSSERDECQPLVIAGGPCITANPLPLAPFFDVLCLGEAETLLPGMLPIIIEGISSPRDELLKALSRLPGLWVPRLNQDKPVARQWAARLDDFPVHSVVLTPDTELNDLYLIEVQRGCAHGCRFCLVTNTFSPMRFHSLDNLIKQVRGGLKNRRRMGLVGPAVTDHPQIEELFRQILEMGGQFSLSSLRITSLNQKILELMVKGGLQSIALAPEAGSECLRGVIKKGISEEQVLKAIEQAAEAGMQQLKLYFMLGLPGETAEDIEAIIKLSLSGKEIIDKKRRNTRLSLNFSPFVPKAGTPFQWLPMAGVNSLERVISYLKAKLTPKGIEIRHESPEWSEIQAVLSRGDSKLGEVLAGIERVSLPAWHKATKKHGLDVDYYAHQVWETTRPLPWSFIDSGVAPIKLEQEMRQAMGRGQGDRRDNPNPQ